MPCRFDDCLAPYLLGALPAGEEREVREHLPLCQECAQVARELSPVGQSLLRVEAGEPPRELRREVRRTVEQQAELFQRAEASPARAWLPRPAFLTAAFAALMLAFLSGSMLRGEPGTPPQGPATLQASLTPLAGKGQVYALRLADGSTRLEARSLPPLSSRQEYHLWREGAGGKIQDMKQTLPVNRAGDAVLPLRERADSRAILVTRSPVGRARPDKRVLVFRLPLSS